MKRILLSMFTLFAVLFTSVVTANAETENVGIRIGSITMNKNTHAYESPVNPAVETGKLASGGYKTYRETKYAYEVGSVWVSKNDGKFTKYPTPQGNVIGVFENTKEIPTYSNSNVPFMAYNKGQGFYVYGYKAKMFVGYLPNGAGAVWLPEADVDFTQFTNDKETPVGTETIGKVTSIQGDIPIYSEPSEKSSVVGTLKQDAFKTTIDVKGKKGEFYNIGENKWIVAAYDKVRFFPVGADTNVYKLVFDAREYEGTPYGAGGYFTNDGKFDETGFIYRVFKDNGYPVGKLDVDAYEKLSPKVVQPRIGDLIFFKADEKGNRNIGIIVSEKGKYMSATAEGVTEKSFNTTDTNISGFGRLR